MSVYLLNILFIPTFIAGLSYASYRISLWSIVKRLQETKSKLLEAGMNEESDIIVDINNHIEKIKCFKADKKMYDMLYNNDISHKSD